MSADDDGALIDFYPYRHRLQTYLRLEPNDRDLEDILRLGSTPEHGGPLQ